MVVLNTEMWHNLTCLLPETRQDCQHQGRIQSWVRMHNIFFEVNVISLIFHSDQPCSSCKTTLPTSACIHSFTLYLGHPFPIPSTFLPMNKYFLSFEFQFQCHIYQEVFWVSWASEFSYPLSVPSSGTELFPP